MENPEANPGMVFPQVVNVEENNPLVNLPRRNGLEIYLRQFQPQNWILGLAVCPCEADNREQAS